ncbi:MAG: hypothetical protein HXX81_07755 [Campylobacterales bacterium]|nr:hypothetical protein [Campylobacterales bacterium]
MRQYLENKSNTVVGLVDKNNSEIYKTKVVGDLGYNAGMENIESKIIDNFKKVDFNSKDTLLNTFSKVWQNDKSWRIHIQKRLNENAIKDEFDYIQKTVDCLANSKEYILAKYKNSWDSVCYNDDRSWAVVFNEFGTVMTSYKISDELESFENKYKRYEAKINKGKTDERFKRGFETIRDNIRLF